MDTITKFYLKNAIYEVELAGETRALVVNYGTNTHEIVGRPSHQLDRIATQLLAKKHAVNFAYKFSAKGGSRDGKIEGEI